MEFPFNVRLAWPEELLHCQPQVVRRPFKLYGMISHRDNFGVRPRDITSRSAPTMRDLLEMDEPVAFSRRAEGEALSEVRELLRGKPCYALGSSTTSIPTCCGSLPMGAVCVTLPVRFYERGGSQAPPLLAEKVNGNAARR